MVTSVRCTAEERALARASMYRVLALAFTYPTVETLAALDRALPAAAVGAPLIDEATVRECARFAAALGQTTDEPRRGTLEADYQRVFTLSYSEDCPPYETAFSARHLFQQTQQQADIAGFYRAFGVDARAERADHLAAELEFCYLLALKEARARADGEPEHVAICRDAQRRFVGEHLARWAPLISGRVRQVAGDTALGAAARLLAALVASEERFLRLGRVTRFRDEPVLIADDPGEMICPYAETAEAGQEPLAVADLPLFESREEALRAVVDVR